MIPTWFKTVGEWAARFSVDVAAAFFGSELAEGNDKKKRVLGEEVLRGVQKELTPDREDVLKELIRLGENGKAIRKLLKKANMFNGGIITVNLPGNRKIRRTENSVINSLLKVDPKDRQWVFARFNRLCQESPAAFLAELELLENDGISQYVRLFAQKAKDILPANTTTNVNNALGDVADFLEGLPGGRS